jgi:hypothetical protein
MMDSATVATLHSILRREGRSLMQYARDAYPWTSSEEGEAVGRLQRLIEAERQACDDIARLLIRRRLPLPFIGSFPASFTSTNFISLSKLISLLSEHQGRSLAALRPELATINDPDARLLVQRLLELKDSHLHELEQLAAAAPAASMT